MKILICPLNWGLGHATRCVPIIRNLIAEGHVVTIVADGYPLEFLRLQFPQLRLIDFPSYPIIYSSRKSQVWAIVKSSPKIITGIYSEHQWLKNLLKTEHFDQIISDNRFGMWNKNVHSIYITHQLMIKMPRALKFLEPVVWLLHQLLISRYNECWIPDNPGNANLSGDLSHKYPLPARAKFIGPLSRFNIVDNSKIDTRYEVVAIVSGIEPQRTIFKEQLISRFQNTNQKILIVLGKPSTKNEYFYKNNITCVSHLADNELIAILNGAKKIISRSGYSSIMDYQALGCTEKVEFIATPGQTEQEYLQSLHEK